MTTLTIRAADSAAALDEVQRRLGPEALILSTRQSRGMVEIVAGTADTRPTPRATSPLIPADRRLLPHIGDQMPPITAQAGTAQAGTAQTGTAQTGTGFAAHLAQAMGDDATLACLPPHLTGRVVLVGPPGSGRSLMAARLAAASLRAGGGSPRPVLIAPRPDPLTGAGALAGWARLMSVPLHRPVWSAGLPPHLPPPDPETLEIIDLSDMPLISADPLILWRDLDQTQIWLVVPTGLHPDCHARICPALAGIVRLIVLTRADLCPPTADDLALQATYGITPALIAEGTGLVDVLCPLPPPPPPVVTAQDVSSIADAAFTDPTCKDMSDAATRLS
jgi:hypothetical protein